MRATNLVFKVFGFCTLLLRESATSAQPNSPEFTTNILDRAKLTSLMSRIEPWPNMPSTYSAAGWSNLISAATYIQSCNSTSVETTLKQYVAEFPYRRKFPTNAPISLEKVEKTEREDSKLFILLRVIFNLPERSETKERYYPWYTLGTEVNPDGTINVAWPLSWKNGEPNLVSGATGVQGPVGFYDAAREYLRFSSEYPFRDLKHVRAPSGAGTPQSGGDKQN
jgi:hypothetical protein